MQIENNTKMAVLQVVDDSFEKVAKKYEKSVKSVEDDVDILEEWVKKQPHLPEIMDRKLIKNFLVSNKFSIERTKQKIDNYYTIRSTIPEFYDISNPKRENMRKLADIAYYCPLPKQTQDPYRVFLIKCPEGEQLKIMDLNSLAAFMHNVQEVRLHEDCMCGDIAIIDFRTLTMEFMLRLTPTLCMKIFSCYEKVYSIPLKALHMINSPSYLGYLLNVFKGILKPKIFNRINLHKDDNILMDLFPKEIIPKEYGGEEKSLEEIKTMWSEKFKEYQERFDKLDTMRVDESLRPNELVNDDILGFHGNFKQLDVD